MFIKRLDVVMYGLTPKPDLETAFKNLYLKLKYLRIIFEGEH